MGAMSFSLELGGLWATSDARKYAMFNGSPGCIQGKRKDTNGTVTRAYERDGVLVR